MLRHSRSDTVSPLWTDLSEPLRTAYQGVATARRVHAVYHAPCPPLTLRAMAYPVRTIELYSDRWRGVRAFRATVPIDAVPSPEDALLRLTLQLGYDSCLNPVGHCKQLAERLIPPELLRVLLARLATELAQLRNNG